MLPIRPRKPFMTSLRSPRPATRRALVAAAATAALLLAAGAAQADGRMLPSRPLKAWQDECAACHIAFPPALLPAASWKRVMNGLDKHYGVDAAMDAQTTAQIAAWLQSEAGTGKRAREEPAQDRITRSAWFVRKHDEVRADAWKRASVKSPANCAACHTGAERGDYDEDNVRIPR